MFFFSKPKPKLVDLFNGEYIDIHNHLLPGIDDGSKDIEQTKELIKGLTEIGFKEFITTPHVIDGLWNNSTEDIVNTFNKTVKDLKNTDVIAPKKTAAEYMMDFGFHQKLKTEKLLTLKGNYLLVEMSYRNPPINLHQIIFDIQLAGYTPVLAHPERYLFYENNYAEYKVLKEKGCLFQINLLSTVGYYGKEIVKIADRLLEDDFIDFSGSDVHHIHSLQFFKEKIRVKNIDALKTAIKNNNFFKEI